MSLINEMLRDLEARRAGELRQNDLQREIRPLPERRRSSPRALYLAVAGLSLAAAAGGGVWWYAAIQRDAAKVAVVATVVQQPGPSTGPASIPVAPQPAIPVEPGQMPPANSLTSPAAPVTAAPPAPAPVQEQAAAAPVQAPPVVPPARTVLAPVVQAPAPIKPQVAVQGNSEPSPQPPAKAISSRPAVKSAPAAPVVADSGPAKPAVASAPAAPQGTIEKSVSVGSPRERADADFKRAQGLLAGGQAPSALEALQGALKQDASHNQARQLLVKILLESRRQDEAMAVLQEGLEQQPAQIGWAMSLARLIMEKGDVAGAERILARSGTYGRNSDSFVGFHGHLLNRLGQFREAAEQYQAAARLAPADGRWWFGLGQALEGDGRVQEARGAFRRALDSGSLNAELKTLAEQKVR